MHSETFVTFCRANATNKEGVRKERQSWTFAIERAPLADGTLQKPVNATLHLIAGQQIDNPADFLARAGDKAVYAVSCPAKLAPSVTANGHTFTLKIGTAYYSATALRALFGIVKHAEPVAPVVEPVAPAPVHSGKSKGK